MAEGKLLRRMRMLGFWKKVWTTYVPRKIRQFLWRLAHNILALQVNLSMRCMKINPACVMCARQHEDGKHLIFKCKKAQKFWELMVLDDVRVKLVLTWKSTLRSENIVDQARTIDLL